MPSLKKTYSYRHKGWSYPTLDFVLLMHEVALEATEEKFGGFKGGDTGKGMVESAAEAPVKTYDKQDLYPTRFDKAAALGYLVARNHGFNDANKRTALLVVTKTLEWNSEYLEWSEETETLVYRLVGLGELSLKGFKFALLDACGHDVRDAEVLETM